ncbi:Hypothetical protein CAP_4788 [Chondromyces apiculatus DSM 436]|uniref:Phosphodiesterase/alkaline phosphatase D n=1 Tax=Chondromyces apiculatus DSM 436 TaxID=1192034 RepID=A0A017T5N8_9BACT|nr:Hypothetical protein CAP_4788 [Chondromyces apiculatus DSM 436]
MTVGAVLAPAACDDGETIGGECPVAEDSSVVFPQSVASGDPRPDSVILWTRLADAAASGDLEVHLQVALDEEFTQLMNVTVESERRAISDEAGSSFALLTAKERYGHCVKVKLAGLAPATTYYYRFYYNGGGTCYVSRTGRTKTAPDESADVPVRFAYISCQDYIHRFYNTHLALAQEDLDFFVVLGDYVYETTGDPSFQGSASEGEEVSEDLKNRVVKFSDESVAIQLGSGDTIFYAARSLGNYRDLYRTYRSDRGLQALHERFPVVAIWDDHEYSNDCFGATAAYFDGAADELDVTRRKAANQAWFEYMPVDYAAGDDFEYDAAVEYLKDITIYRDFRFGKHLHLVLTDLRSYRDDHLIPENGFPGAVVTTQEQLIAQLGVVPDAAGFYVPIDTYQTGTYQTKLREAATTEGYDPALITGNISVSYINGIIAKLNAAGDATPLIDTTDPTGLKRGIAFVDLAKFGLNTSIGSRYLVDQDAFDAMARVTWSASMGENEKVMGSEQEEWFLDTMQKSDRTWKVWGNEYCLVQLAVNLIGLPIPESFQRRFYMNVDAWDGFPNRRSALIERIGALSNVVAVTGDIHAFYAGFPSALSDPSRRIVEFVGSSMASKTFKQELLSQIKADPILSAIPTASLLAEAVDSYLLSTTTVPNPYLAYANSSDNGFCVAEVTADEFMVTMHQIPAAEVANNYTGREAELLGLVKKVQLKTVAGTKDLQMFDDASKTWKLWDETTRTWV